MIKDGEMLEYHKDDPLYLGILETIRIISQHNDYNFTEKDCINVTNEVWRNSTILISCLGFSEKYKQNNKYKG